GTKGGRSGDALPCGLQKNGIWGVKLQDRFKLFSAKILNPGVANLGKFLNRRGLDGGVNRKGPCQKDGDENTGRGDELAARKQLGSYGRRAKDVHGTSCSEKKPSFA